MKPSSTDRQEVEDAIAQGQEQETSQEQAADLAALQAGVRQEQEAQDAAEAQQQKGNQTAQDRGQEAKPPSAGAVQVAAMAVHMLRPLIAYAVPALRGAPDALWEPIPEGIAGILDHYGVGVDALNSPWGRLAMACVPLAAFAVMNAPKKPDPVQAIEQAAGQEQATSQPAPVWGQGEAIPA